MVKCSHHGNNLDTSPVLTAGLTVFVSGRSHQRGFLIVEYNQQQIHVPHQYTEIKVINLPYMGKITYPVIDTNYRPADQPCYQ